MKASRYLFYSLVLLTCFVARTKAAVAFNGSSQEFTFATPVGWSTNSYTFSAWVNINSFTVSQYPAIIHIGGGNPLTDGLFLEGNSVGTSADGIVLVQGNNVTNAAIQSNLFSLGTWHNICGTWNGTTGLIYLDGNLVSLSYADGGYAGGTNEIGKGNNAWLNGSVDDVRVYNRALSANEVASIGKSRNRINITTGLIAYWRMDDGFNGIAISSATDYSGQKNVAQGVSNPTMAIGVLNYP